MSDPKLCAVVPAFNEERHVAGVVAGVKAHLEPVVVVDDGSKDETAQVAEAAGAVVLVHPVNRGKGAAIRTGAAWALENGFEAALFLDADGQHAPEEVPAFVAQYAATHADLVIGSRMHDTSGMPFVRRCSNRFSSGVISRLAGTRVTDSQSGYRLFSGRMLRYLLGLQGDRFDFESEMIIDAVRGGMTYAEVPIRCIYGKEWKSHYHPLRDSLEFFAMAWRKRRR